MQAKGPRLVRKWGRQRVAVADRRTSGDWSIPGFEEEQKMVCCPKLEGHPVRAMAHSALRWSVRLRPRAEGSDGCQPRKRQNLISSGKITNRGLPSKVFMLLVPLPTAYSTSRGHVFPG